MSCVSDAGRAHIGMSPSGKAPDFDSGMRRFESCHPSQYDPLAQLAEQLPFKQWVRGSNPRRVTKNTPRNMMFRGCFSAFSELFGSIQIELSDRVADLLQTAFVFIFFDSLLRSSTLRCV